MRDSNTNQQTLEIVQHRAANFEFSIKINNPFANIKRKIIYFVVIPFFFCFCFFFGLEKVILANVFSRPVVARTE